MKRYPNMLDFAAARPYLFLRANHTYGRRLQWHVAANHLCTLSCPLQNATPWNAGSGQPRLPPGSHGGGESSCCWRLGSPNPTWAKWLVSNGASCASGPGAFWLNAWQDSLMPPVAGRRAFFPPEV